MKAIMFFDGGCPLCRREVAHYRFLDRRNRVGWIDISREADLLLQCGIDRDAAMRRLHALDERGRVVSGISAFVVVWRQLPLYRYLAWFVERFDLVPLLERIYVRFAAWRFRRRCGNTACTNSP
jgi:predicted DCC family thiol-disulfide oxidoreductase YuxK